MAKPSQLGLAASHLLHCRVPKQRPKGPRPPIAYCDQGMHSNSSKIHGMGKDAHPRGMGRDTSLSLEA